MTDRMAQVEWLPPGEGGRQSLPDGTRYVTISRFPQDGTEWPDGAWSVVVDFDNPPAQQGRLSRGRVRFLMDSAPTERLHAGAQFDLYEGRKRVAHVKVIE